ncbi:intraflagellar transport protein 27 homolog isoform X2 [Neocloeon triangulifer]|uniref:intraflagellar transport protein 27 homolog isoform X2 n=1 Tax=Neocloeon triangulifer TaxID=2078957 RepID=UPI00286F4CEE|nr:intraflagellar transport protein 27 homolog isoform X2 [Neocloeon triangulifer]
MIDIRSFHCYLIGDALVGKTAITQMFLSDGAKFPKTYNLTTNIELNSKLFSIPGESADHKVQFIIYDTSGHDIYNDIIRKCLNKKCDVVLLVYDVTSTASFENLKEWIKLISEAETIGKDKMPIFVLGNKSDLHNRRTVFLEGDKSEEMMKEFEVLQTVEGSAKNYEGVHEIFTAMAQYLVENS